MHITNTNAPEKMPMPLESRYRRVDTDTSLLAHNAGVSMPLKPVSTRRCAREVTREGGGGEGLAGPAGEVTRGRGKAAAAGAGAVRRGPHVLRGSRRSRRHGWTAKQNSCLYWKSEYLPLLEINKANVWVDGTRAVDTPVVGLSGSARQAPRPARADAGAGRTSGADSAAVRRLSWMDGRRAAVGCVPRARGRARGPEPAETWD